LQRNQVPLCSEISCRFAPIYASWANVQGLRTTAHGNAFDRGNVVPFARGGVVDRPTIFPMQHGQGLMGEAGPEAVVPLKRMPSGNLGVETGGGGRPLVNFVVNNNHPTAKVSSEQREDAAVSTSP
jgi:phage-related minor tail protein